MSISIIIERRHIHAKWIINVVNNALYVIKTVGVPDNLSILQFYLLNVGT